MHNLPKTSISQSRNKLSRWLITGGCGFIGLNLVKSLVTEGADYICVLDNLSVGTKDDLASVCAFTELGPRSPNTCDSKVQLIVGDIKDYHTCLKASHNIDVVVHLAANTGVGPSVENPLNDMEANVIGTFNMLEAARQNRVDRFIFASSGAPIGECEPPIHEELAPHPVSPYGASKLAGEGYCSAYFSSFGLKTVALRFGNVYGPGSGHKNSVIAKFIKQIIEGEPIEVYGDGKQTRDFIYIDDLVQAIEKAASPPSLNSSPWGEVFQIATNRESTVNELVEKLVIILDRYGYKDIKVKYGEPRLGDVKRNYSNTSKAKKMLNWQNSTDLEKGLQRTVEWFLKN